MAASLGLFAVAAAVSLATSWLLVARIERLGERLGLNEAVLGLLAALAADGPEITAAITALSHHQHAVGAGVVLGSNVFNLAALLGLVGLVAGRTRMHRRVIALDGSAGLWVAGVTAVAVGTALPAGAAVAACLLVLVPYLATLSGQDRLLRRVPVPARARRWVLTAVAEEEADLSAAIHPPRGRPADAVVGAVALVVVVVSAVAMERSATDLGRHAGLPDIIVGGLVLAVVTSLPNAVAGYYWARRGRGAAALSTALNSNTINVMAGLLLPALVTGLVAPDLPDVLVASAYAALTAVSLALAWAGRGVGRRSGGVIVAGYLGVVAALSAVTLT